MTDERFIYDGNGVPRPNPAFAKQPQDGAGEQIADENFERRIGSYLLGQLAGREAMEFEDECFAQECWPACIEAVEDDLIDDYLHEELLPEQRRLFEQNYLTSEGRQTRVRTAAALLRRVCEADAETDVPVVVVPEQRTWAERIKVFWSGQRWPLRAGFAVAMLVIVVGGLWFYLTRVRPPLVVATLRLTSSFSTRSEGAQARTIKLHPNAGALRVSLVLPNNSAPASRYRVELDTDDGETTPLDIAGQDAQSVSVVIPASRLARGQYALTLYAVNSDGTEQPVYGSYIFTVE